MGKEGLNKVIVEISDFFIKGYIPVVAVLVGLIK
jgi:hypothetical protein